MADLKRYKERVTEYVNQGKRWFCKHVFKNPHAADHLSVREVGDYVSLTTGFGINLFMSILKMVFGVIYASGWLISIGIYYLLLSGIRFMLLFREWRSTYKENATEHRIYDIKSYRFCGILVFVLNWLLLGMGIPMIYQNPNREYSNFLMVALVIYAVYNLFVAIMNSIRFFKIHNPILTAAKRVSLVTALVSGFSLESAWVAKYGVPKDFLLSRLVNSITGSVVGFFIFVIACSMIIQANFELRKMRKVGKRGDAGIGNG
ncbi:MAG: hypothetical protein PUB52_03275 [Lachnospiraceae bacterium]|nr:hypothetical protein [Lachnospiraceae bacterium]